MDCNKERLELERVRTLLSQQQMEDLWQMGTLMARLISILHMVPGNEFGGMIKLHGKEPQSFFIGTCVSSPVDKIEELAGTPSPINLRVKDFLNFIFDFSIDLNQRWRSLNSIRNGAWVGEFELGDMEDGVH